MKRRQEIRAVLHLPETEADLKEFQHKMCNFFTAQLEKQLYNYNLTKEKKLEIVHLVMEDYRNTQ